MSEKESTPTDDLVEKIHEIQEEIFDREDQIDELVDASELDDSVLEVVEKGKVRRRELHLKRLRADWDRMVERSRRSNESNDFELAAALVHFVGDILMSQTGDEDEQWIERLKEYIRDHRELVN